MPQTRVSNAPMTNSATPVPSYQERLNIWCQQYGVTPQYQVVTDRRGGRTAWSCAVVVGSTKVNARFWYDGQFVNSAKEDAAEMALIQFKAIKRQVTFRYFG